MNINNIISQQGIIYDRYLGSSLQLPYSSFDSIKIQPNETVTNFNINNIITKLYDNYLYLYKSAHVASNVIPITSVAVAGVYNNSFNWYNGINSALIGGIGPSLAGPGAGVQTTPGVLAVKYNKDLDQYILATTTINGLSGVTLNFLKSNSTFTNITTAFITNTTFQGSNINFKKIQDIIFGDDNSMYVLDISANSIYLYDASGFLTNNNLLQNILVYKNYTGGFGSFIDNTKFNAPVSIDYYNSTLYVLDAGNSCIKTYDKNLNWLLTYRLFKDFLSAGPIQITHDQFGNNYVLNNNWTVYKYSNNFNNKQIFDFTALSAAGDQVKRITFSLSDSNIFYLTTQNNVYKKLINTPYDTVGKYQLSGFNITNQYFSTFATLSTVINNVNYDYNFTISNQAGANNRISLFLDNPNIVSVLTNDVFDVYPLSGITIDKEEYLQNWVINKSISKLLMNHMRLRDNISSKFLFTQDVIPGDTLLAGTRYLLPSELTSLYFTQDVTNFIGVNEIFQNNIVNRPFENIFNIQTRLLSALAADVRNYSSVPQIVYLN